MRGLCCRRSGEAREHRVLVPTLAAISGPYVHTTPMAFVPHRASEGHDAGCEPCPLLETWKDPQRLARRLAHGERGWAMMGAGGTGHLTLTERPWKQPLFTTFP